MNQLQHDATASTSMQIGTKLFIQLDFDVTNNLTEIKLTLYVALYLASHEIRKCY